MIAASYLTEVPRPPPPLAQQPPRPALARRARRLLRPHPLRPRRARPPRRCHHVAPSSRRGGATARATDSSTSLRASRPTVVEMSTFQIGATTAASRSSTRAVLSSPRGGPTARV